MGREGPRKRLARRVGLVLFLIYTAVLVYFLFFADWYGHAPGILGESRCNLLPGHEIRRFLRARNMLGRRAVLLNLAGNVAGFVPFGFFMPVITGRMRSFLKTTAAAALLSAAVELIQYLTAGGICDIDDVILNTFGAVIGYALFLAADELRKILQRTLEG